MVFNLEHSECPAELPLHCRAAVPFIKWPRTFSRALTQKPPVIECQQLDKNVRWAKILPGTPTKTIFTNLWTLTPILQSWKLITNVTLKIAERKQFYPICWGQPFFFFPICAPTHPGPQHSAQEITPMFLYTSAGGGWGGTFIHHNINRSILSQ